jgi:hypothetical protein
LVVCETRHPPTRLQEVHRAFELYPTLAFAQLFDHPEALSFADDKFRVGA